jgi:hypothetical protein
MVGGLLGFGGGVVGPGLGSLGVGGDLGLSSFFVFYQLYYICSGRIYKLIVKTI